MYAKALRNFKLAQYSCLKNLASKYLRFQFPHDAGAINIVSRFPSAAHQEAIS
jgi:hypothetical protein